MLSYQTKFYLLNFEVVPHLSSQLLTKHNSALLYLRFSSAAEFALQPYDLSEDRIFEPVNEIHRYHRYFANNYTYATSKNHILQVKPQERHRQTSGHRFG